MVDILKTIVASAAAADNDALNQSFAAYGNYQMYRAINIATHTHINEMGILLLLLSLVQAFVYYSERWKRRWAQVLVVSAFGLPLGIILELQVGVVGSILADLFGFTAIVALMAMLFGLLRHTGATDSQQGATT